MPVDPSSLFSAVGWVTGTLHQDENQHWFLTIGDQQYRVSLNPYRKSFKYQIAQHTLQQCRAYPFYNRETEQLEFQIMRVSPPRESPSLFTLQGCWQQAPADPLPYLVIHRNEKRQTDEPPLSSYLPLTWPNAPVADGRFWHLSALLDGQRFIVQSVEGPLPVPPTWQERQDQGLPFPSTGSLDSHTATPLSIEDIEAMAIATDIQLICKITEVPPTRKIDGRVEFFLHQGDQILSVRVKAKRFKKLTSHGFEHWEATIIGEVGPPTLTGFELINVRIQGIEQKPPPNAQNASDPESLPQPTPKKQPSPPSPPPKGKIIQTAKPAAATAKKRKASQTTKTKKQKASQTPSPQPSDSSPTSNQAGRKKKLTDGIYFG